MHPIKSCQIDIYRDILGSNLKKGGIIEWFDWDVCVKKNYTVSVYKLNPSYSN